MVFLYIKINRTVGHIRISIGNNLLDHHNLLHNMSGSCGFDGRIQVVELVHGPMEKIGVFLHQLHRFKFLEDRFLRDLIFCLPALFFKVARIGNVAHITHLVPEKGQVPVYNIKGDERPGVTKMAFSTYGGSTHVESNMSGGYRYKILSLSAQRIIHFQRHSRQKYQFLGSLRSVIRPR